jgi:general stress protein 26
MKLSPWILILVAAAACRGESPSSGADTLPAPVSAVPRGELYKVATDSAILGAARALMLADSNVALVTVDSTGQPRVRTVKAFVDPPVSGKPDKAVTVWIMTRMTTRKVGQIQRNPNVTLYFNNDATVEYATIMGRAIVHTDPDDPEVRPKYDADYAKFFWPEFPRGFVMIEVRPRWLEYLGPRISANPDTWRPQAVVFDSTGI